MFMSYSTYRKNLLILITPPLFLFLLAFYGQFVKGDIDVMSIALLWVLIPLIFLVKLLIRVGNYKKTHDKIAWVD